MSPKEKAERFIELHKMYTVLPPDDVNLSHDLYVQRMTRMLINLQGNKSLTELESLLGDAQISDFFRKQLVHEFGLGQIASWTRWGEFQERFMKDYLGISPSENKLGIFDPNADTVLKIEADYYNKMLPLLKFREGCGVHSPMSYQDWGEDLYKRISERKK